MSILSGLGKLGLSTLEDADVFAEDKKEEKAAASAQEAKKPEITDYVFYKGFECPVCYEKFNNATMKGGKVKMVGQDSDLRPRYEPIDPMKYDVVVCPKCGYAALTRYFDKITPPQGKLVKENISKSFRGIKSVLNITYDDAIERYQLALGNAIVKKGKASEKAYICLKMAWIVRGKIECIDPDDPDYDTQVAELKQDEMELLKNAFDGFIAARQSESFPMCGMDETTIDYILSVTGIKLDKMDIAQKLISGILINPSANPRIKDKTRELKEQILGRNK